MILLLRFCGMNTPHYFAKLYCMGRVLSLNGDKGVDFNWSLHSQEKKASQYEKRICHTLQFGTG